MNKIDAFILIGGRSSRFGCDKVAALFDGTSMTGRIADSIRNGIGPVRIRLVSANENQLLGLNIDKLDGFVFDIFPGRGPAAGVHAALSNAQSEWAFVAACDLPLISGDLIRFLTSTLNDDVDVVVPVQPDGRLQPLAAFYRVTPVRDRITELLERQRPAPSLTELIEQLRLCRVEFGEIASLPGADLLFTNVNRQEDLLEAENRLRKFRIVSEPD